MTRDINRSVVIRAAPEKIWEVLWGIQSYRDWTSSFSESSDVETNWREGSSILFIDRSRSGIFGQIREMTSPRKMIFEYDGRMADGKKDTESEEAKELRGIKEIYTLDPGGDSCRLTIQTSLPEKTYDKISYSWDKALDKIKNLSER